VDGELVESPETGKHVNGLSKHGTCRSLLVCFLLCICLIHFFASEACVLIAVLSKWVLSSACDFGVLCVSIFVFLRCLEVVPRSCP
jgi:hypothetical protein